MPAVWRIATVSGTAAADDLSGAGAAAFGGRWNSAGRPLVYAAQSIALACLETLVHANIGTLPLRRFLVRIDVPDAVWNARTVLAPPYPAGWSETPAGIVSVEFGDHWLLRAASALLDVPSVVVPEERNLLINPMHPDAGRIVAKTLRPWRYDSRLLR